MNETSAERLEISDKTAALERELTNTAIAPSTTELTNVTAQPRRTAFMFVSRQTQMQPSHGKIVLSIIKQ